MSLQVIGAGFGRTGTNSLKIALEQLGLGPCYHMLELRQRPQDLPFWWQAVQHRSVDWPGLFTGYRSAVDFPVCCFWEPLAARFPDAKVILTERDPDDWYDSASSTIFRAIELPREDMQPDRKALLEMVEELIFKQLFSGKHRDRQHAIATYLSHNERVKTALPAKRLLVFNASQGWKPLCEFLELDIPDHPYPTSNSRGQYTSKMFKDEPKAPRSE